MVGARPGEERRVGEARPGGVQLRDEDVVGGIRGPVHAHEGRLESPGSGRVVATARVPDHVGASSAVHGNAVSLPEAIARATEESRIDEIGSRRVQFRDEHVAPTRVVSPWRGREAHAWPAGDVCAARTVDRDASAYAFRATEVGRVDETRVDHDWVARVAVSHAEAKGIARRPVEPEAAGKRDSAPADPLVAAGSLVGQSAESGLDPKISRLGKREPFSSRVSQADVGDACPGADGELVDETPGLAAKDHVDARPEVAVDDLAIGRQTGLPPRAIGVLDVVDGPLTAVARHHTSVRIGAEEAQVQHLLALSLGEGQHHFVFGEVEAEAGPLRVVRNAAIGLPPVRHEGQRKLSVGVSRASPHGRGHGG